MLQVAYFSTAAVPQTAETIDKLLVQSRSNNLRDGITGLLVAGGNRYMQVIEGSAYEVESLYDRIRNDDRHLAVTTLTSRKTFRRDFEGWSMAFRAEPDLGEFVRFPDMVRYLTEQVDNGQLREQIHRFAAGFIAHPRGPDAAPWQLAG